MEMLSQIPDFLVRRRDSETLAIEASSGRWSYRMLYQRATKLAGLLATLYAGGVKQGDRVAVMARDALVFTAMLHALRMLKAILVPINLRLTPKEIAWQLADANVALLVSDAMQEGPRDLVTRVLRDEHDVQVMVLTLDALHWDETYDAVSSPYINLGDIQSIVYTSGTTGRPKGAMISYGNHFYGAAASAFRLGVQTGDRWLTPMPLFHVGGQAVLMRSLIYGTAAVIHDAFDPGKVNRAIDEQGITLLSVVPAMLSRMMDERGAKPFPSALRSILLGGGPVAKSLLQKCAGLNIPVSLSYGLTEANSQVATLAPEFSLKKLGSSGQPLALTEIRIEQDGEEAPTGAAGEIVLRGPTIISGYYGRDDETQKAFSGGWFHTGDIGYIDEEGFIYVLDRRTDLIISGGENVYPAEVESVLAAHPAVVEAGVTGVPDDRFGQAPLAVVVLYVGQEVSEQDIISYCRAHLAGYKTPKHIRFVEKLPRNASGKLLRRDLRQWL